MVQRRAARYVQNNYHNTSSVTSMIDTLGWPTLAERRLKTRLIMLYKITHALIAIPNNILIPTDSRTRKSHNQTFRHITQKDTYKWSFFPHTIVQWNILPQTIISSPSIDLFILKNMGAAIIDFRVCPPLVKCKNLMFSGFIDTLMYGFSSTSVTIYCYFGLKFNDNTCCEVICKRRYNDNDIMATNKLPGMYFFF